MRQRPDTGPSALATRRSDNPLLGVLRSAVRGLRSPHLLALLLCLIGFGLRAYRLDNKNLWYDEGFSVYMARQSLTDLPVETARDVHPPLYFAILHGWRALAGESAFALRFPSAVAGTLTLALAYRVLRRHVDARAGLVAMALLAVHRPSIWYSQEVRMYALAMLLAVAALAAMLAYLRDGRWRALVAYALLGSAGLHTIYLFVLAPVALGLAGLLALGVQAGPDRRRRVLSWIGANVAVALSLLPWLWFALPYKPERFSESTPVGLIDVLGLWLNTLLVGSAPAPDAAWADWPTYALALGAVGLAAWILWRRRARANATGVGLGLAAAFGAAATISLIWLLNQPWSFQLTFAPTPRYLVGLTPWALMALGVALSIVIARWHWPGLITTVALVGVMAASSRIYYTDRYATDTFRSAGLTLQAYRRPEDGLLLHNNREWPIVAYEIGEQPRRDVPFEVYISDAATAERYAQEEWSTHDAVWLLLTRESLLNDYDHYVLRWFQERAVASRSWDFSPTAELWVFARTQSRGETLDQPITAPDHALVDAAPGLQLVGVERALPEVKVGETLRLFLTWRAQAGHGQQTFGLRLNSWLGGTADEIPFTVPANADGVFRQQIDFPIRPYVGAGHYDVRVTDRLGGEAFDPALTSIDVTTAWPLPAAARPLSQPSTVFFQNGLAIRTWEAERVDDRLLVRLDWEVTRLADRRYKQFVHLIAADGRRIAQGDAEPLGGFPPFTAWPAGARVPDTLTLNLPADTPAGTYTLVTGLYDPVSGERLPVIADTGVVLGDSAGLGAVSIP